MPDYSPFNDYIQYPTKNDFPEVGELNVLYYDIEADQDYTWDVQSEDYARYGGDRPVNPPHNP